MPQRSRVYQHHHLDSTRWDSFQPRSDDIVIATSYKAGTTWTQAIVANLLFPDQDFPVPAWQMSPWLDMSPPPPLDEVIATLEAQGHRRFIKTHLALDGLLFYPQVKYIFVSRDGRGCLRQHEEARPGLCAERRRDLEGGRGHLSPQGRQRPLARCAVGGGTVAL